MQNAQRHPAMAAICHCICILQLAFNDYRMESKILRRVRYVMNILPSFSPYPSSSLPLTTTDTKGSALDNEQKKSKIMVAGAKRSRQRRAQCGVQIRRAALVGAHLRGARFPAANPPRFRPRHNLISPRFDFLISRFDGERADVV